MTLSAEIISISLMLILMFVSIGMVLFLIDLTRARLVPFVRSTIGIRKKLLEHLKLEKDDVFIELGCGDGDIVSKVADKYPGIEARGYEIALFPYFRGKIKQRKAAFRYKLLNRNFMKDDLSDATVLYSYLMPYYMEPLWKKIKKECNPGTKLYTLAFQVHSETPEEIIEVPNPKKASKVDKLYIYKV